MSTEEKNEDVASKVDHQSDKTPAIGTLESKVIDATIEDASVSPEDDNTAVEKGFLEIKEEDSGRLLDM